MGGISPDRERETEMGTMRNAVHDNCVRKRKGLRPRHAARRTYPQPARGIMLPYYMNSNIKVYNFIFPFFKVSSIICSSAEHCPTS